MRPAARGDNEDDEYDEDTPTLLDLPWYPIGMWTLWL